MSVLYFDNAASSWPKPPKVAEAMMECVRLNGANPGRGSHQMAVQASRMLFETRKSLGKLLKVKNPNDISFALNTTMALNQAIFGFVKNGDHVICTNVEHNSVRRPLEYLKKHCDVQVTYIEADRTGQVQVGKFISAFQSNTTLVVCNHSSNLLGTILPIDQIAEVAKKKGAKLLVDGAQTVGILPIDVQGMGIDMLAFPGHKGLLGPQGTGGLYVASDLELDPLIMGGTGSQSESIEQPSVRPDRYEAGTQNTVGITGLNEGVKFILNEGVEAIHNKEWKQIQLLMEGLMSIEGVRLLGPELGVAKTGIASFIMNNADSSEVAYMLDHQFNIAVRAGYHCTPLAHEAAGTTKTGAVRASIGYFTTEQEIEQFLIAVRELSVHFQKVV